MIYANLVPCSNTMLGAFVSGNRTFSENVGVFGEIFEDCRIWLHYPADIRDTAGWGGNCLTETRFFQFSGGNFERPSRNVIMQWKTQRRDILEFRFLSLLL